MRRREKSRESQSRDRLTLNEIVLKRCATQDDAHLCSDAVKCLCSVTLVILDLVSLVEHAESPATVLEPASLGGVGLVGSDDEIGMTVGELILETRAFTGGTVEAKRLEAW